MFVVPQLTYACCLKEVLFLANMPSHEPKGPFCGRAFACSRGIESVLGEGSMLRAEMDCLRNPPGLLASSYSLSSAAVEGMTLGEKRSANDHKEMEVLRTPCFWRLSSTLSTIPSSLRCSCLFWQRAILFPPLRSLLAFTTMARSSTCMTTNPTRRVAPSNGKTEGSSGFALRKSFGCSKPSKDHDQTAREAQRKFSASAVRRVK